MSSRVMISDAFIQAGHLFSAATLSETSLCEITPVSLPLAFITPTERTCFSRRYCAARCTLVSSVIEKISLRDPMRSDTFTGPSAGHSGRIVGLTWPRLQDEFQHIPGQNKTWDEKERRDSGNPFGRMGQRRPRKRGQARAASPRTMSYRS